MVGQQQGWHKEDIKAAVRKRGKTLAQLSRDNDLCDSATRQALIRPLYPAEQAIADFIGVPAGELWPERYDSDGTPRHPHTRARILRRRRRERAA